MQTTGQCALVLTPSCYHLLPSTVLRPSLYPSVPVGNLLGSLDGWWTVEPYPSPDRKLYGRTRQTVRCAALILPHQFS